MHSDVMTPSLPRGRRRSLQAQRQLVPATPRPQINRSGRQLTRAILPILVIVLWQFLSSLGVFNPRILPPPTAVLTALWDLYTSGVLMDSLSISLRRAASGFVCGAVTGVVLGIAAGLFVTAEHSYDSTLQMLRTIPFLALVPLFVVWFGLGEFPKILLISIACFFPAYLNTFGAVRAVDVKVLEAAHVFGMSRMSTIISIILPQSLPGIFVGLRYSVGVSLLALVGAEQVNAVSGIGYLALSPRASLRPDIVLAIIVVYAVLGLVFDSLIRWLGWALTPWLRARTTRTVGGSR